jgi:hypothetical protein
VSAAGRRRRFPYACLVLWGGAAIGATTCPVVAFARPAAAPAPAKRPAPAPAKRPAPAPAKRPPRAVQSIVGGAGASIAGFPFQVALYDPADGGPEAGFFCGGVIVDVTHVITAAHCLTGGGAGGGAGIGGGGRGAGGVAGEIEVLAGSTSLGRPTPGSVRDPAVAVAIDPAYDQAKSGYDVGVITLAHALWPGPVAPRVDGVSTIAPLPVEPAVAAVYGEAAGSPGAPATLATVSGWGDTSAAPSGSPSYPEALRSVSVPLVPERVCGEQYGGIELTITPAMICAGSSRPQADSCYGDSGGPLVVDRDTPAHPPGDYVLVGLVAFGAGCAQAGLPGVYTRIGDPAVARYLTSGIASAARASSRAVSRPPGKSKKRRQKRRRKHRRHHHR